MTPYQKRQAEKYAFEEHANVTRKHDERLHQIERRLTRLEAQVEHIEEKNANPRPGAKRQGGGASEEFYPGEEE